MLVVVSWLNNSEIRSVAILFKKKTMIGKLDKKVFGLDV